MPNTKSMITKTVVNECTPKVAIEKANAGFPTKKLRHHLLLLFAHGPMMMALMKAEGAEASVTKKFVKFLKVVAREYVKNAPTVVGTPLVANSTQLSQKRSFSSAFILI